jgi:hypothetical protein
MKGKLVLKYEILISKEQLAEYIQGYLRYIALENGGVDNWSWFGASLGDFLDNHGADDFSELVEEELRKYEVVI